MDNFKLCTKHVACERPEYKFEIFEYRRGEDQCLFAHLAFSKFTPSVLKQALADYRLFRQCVSAPLFAVCNDGDFDKWAKFVSRFGFRPTGITITCENGEERPLFINLAVGSHVFSTN